MAKLVEQLQARPGSLKTTSSPAVIRPLEGTTMYIAECSVDTRFGIFRAYVFQDVVDKHYVIALAHGDIVNAPRLYTRLHSSCVTSETLRSCDCDCSSQLEAAFRVIAQNKHGIMFYLLQEGRGVGYVCKSRGCMLVQAADDQLTTFDAYKSMGLRHDHRDYSNITHICRMLGVTAPFVLLTNNPDKIKAMRNLGVAFEGTQSIEVEPSTFNAAYLISKRDQGGHRLSTKTARVARVPPPQMPEVFQPVATLHNAKRFVYCASYFLPVKPIDDDVLVSAAVMAELFAEKPIEAYMADSPPAILSYTELRGGRFLIKIDPLVLAALSKEHPEERIGELLATPYWFRVHVYFDVVTTQDFVVLTHGDRPGVYDKPVVRLHSESLFDRFPLRNTIERAKYKASIKAIATYGCGVLMLMYNDGRGSGFGSLALARMLNETAAAYSSGPPAVGARDEARDYHAPLLLLRHHLSTEVGCSIQLMMNTPDSLAPKSDLFSALKEQGITVADIIFMRISAYASHTAPSPPPSALRRHPAVDAPIEIARPATDEGMGLNLIASRMASIPGLLAAMAAAPLPQLSAKAHAASRFIVTGIGSSEAHARYLVWLISTYVPRVAARFVALSAFVGGAVRPDDEAALVVFSQGVSPNAQLALRQSRGYAHTVLFTSTTAADERASGRADRALVLEELAAQGADFMKFPQLSEYTTLIRVIGPAAGFMAAYTFVAALATDAARAASVDPPRFERATPAAVQALATLRAPDALMRAMRTDSAAFEGSFCLIAAAPLAEFAMNIAYKFMEGLFWRCPQVTDLLAFAHGPFQQLCMRPRPVVILQCNVQGEAELVSRCLDVLRGVGLMGYVVTVDAPPDLAVIGFEAIFNEIVLMMMRVLRIDQINFPGKNSNGALYSMTALTT